MKKKRTSNERTPKPLVALPNGIDAKTVALIVSAGYVPIITDEPEKVKVIIPSPALESSNDVLMAAMHGVIEAPTGARSPFVAELYRRMLAREEKAKP